MGANKEKQQAEVPPVNSGSSEEVSAGVDGQDNQEDKAANDIAATLIGFLVSGFKQKEGRDPTQEEVEDLLSELTEDRINEMLGGALDTHPASTETEPVAQAQGQPEAQSVEPKDIAVESSEVPPATTEESLEKEAQVWEQDAAAAKPAFAFSWPAAQAVAPADASVTDENSVGNKRPNETQAAGDAEPATKKPLEFQWSSAAATAAE